MTAFIDNLLLALGTLRSNPLRSLLTLIGIVIGAATVVAMMSLIEGLRLKVQKDFSFIGAGSFHIQRTPPIDFGSSWMKYRRRKQITRKQAEALKSCCPHVARLSIEVFARPSEAVTTKDRATKPNIDIYGGTPDFESANGYNTALGRFVTDVDVELGRKVVVIGADVADVLFPGVDPIGEEVRLRTEPYTVIGVLERMGSVLGLASKDTLVIVPISAFDLTFGSNRGIEITVQATEPDKVSAAQDEIVYDFRRIRGLRDDQEADFEVFTNDTLTAQFNQLAATIGAATFGVCALALLVGGIGIMNIMLVSVVERTREIGIRKALGARRRRIMAQFVTEATALSFLGGTIGVLLGVGVALATREFFPLPAAIPPWAVALSLVSACGCGIVFGIYPASRASRLDPVEAMRTE
jgi:putative ABC transport system permease protein